MKVNDTLVWYYKNDIGEHISVFAKLTETHIKDPDCFNCNYFTTRWACHIVKSDSSYYDSLEESSRRIGVTPLYMTYLQTQYDNQIGIDEILNEYSASVSRMCISAVKHAKCKIV